MMKQKNKSLWPLMGLPGLVWYAVLGILSPVVSALFALSLQPIVDAGLSGDMAQFGQVCLLAVLLAAADLLFMYGVQYSRAILVNRSTRLLSQAYFGYILRQQPWAFASGPDSGSCRDLFYHPNQRASLPPFPGNDPHYSGKEK